MSKWLKLALYVWALNYNPAVSCLPTDPLTLPPTHLEKTLLEELNSTHPFSSSTTNIEHQFSTNFINFLRVLEPNHKFAESSEFIFFNWIISNPENICFQFEKYIEKYGAYCLVMLAYKLPEQFIQLLTKPFSNQDIQYVKIKGNKLHPSQLYHQKWQPLFFQELINDQHSQEIKLHVCQQMSWNFFSPFIQWLSELNQGKNTNNTLLTSIMELYWQKLPEIKQDMQTQSHIIAQNLTLILLEPEKFWGQVEKFKKYFKRALSDFNNGDWPLIPEKLIAANPEYFLNLILFRQKKFNISYKYYTRLSQLIRDYPAAFIKVITKNDIRLNPRLFLSILNANPELLFQYDKELRFDLNEFQSTASDWLNLAFKDFPQVCAHLIATQKIPLNHVILFYVNKYHPTLFNLLRSGPNRMKYRKTWRRKRRPYNQRSIIQGCQIIIEYSIDTPIIF